MKERISWFELSDRQQQAMLNLKSLAQIAHPGKGIDIALYRDFGDTSTSGEVRVTIRD